MAAYHKAQAVEYAARASAQQKLARDLSSQRKHLDALRAKDRWREYRATKIDHTAKARFYSQK
jgi:hypothetical protein